LSYIIIILAEIARSQQQRIQWEKGILKFIEFDACGGGMPIPPHYSSKTPTIQFRNSSPSSRKSKQTWRGGDLISFDQLQIVSVFHCHRGTQHKEA